MTKQKPQVLTLESLNKKTQHANRKERFYLDEDEFEYIEYNPVFSKSKRVDLLQELFATVQECNEKNLPIFMNEVAVMKYLEFLILKYFTSIKNMLLGTTIEAHIEVMKQLIDHEILDVFINEVFDIDEVSKVFNEYNMAKSRLGKYLEELERNTKIQENVAQQKINDAKFKEIAKKAVK